MSNEQRLTTGDIAKLFGVTRKTVTDRWVPSPDFPKPVQVISRRTRFWDREAVMRWRTQPGA